jgi:hypothetical protein
VELLGKNPPDLARVCFHRLAIPASDAQLLKRNALRVEHAEYIVIRRDEQRGGITEILIGREPPWISMAVWRQDRKI